MNVDVKSTADPVKKSILFIQITRFGDLIQTAQAVKKTRENFPDMELTLIARKQFATPLRSILEEIFDQVYTLDSDFHLSGSLIKTRTAISEWVRNINKFPPTISINLSFSRSSSYLHSLIQSQHKIGPYIDMANNSKVNDHWSQYLYATVLDGPYNPYSLVDLYSMIIGNTDHSASKPKRPPEKRNKILVHPFASQRRKVWKRAKWVDLLYKLLSTSEDLEVTVCGSHGDVDEALSILNNPILARYKDRIINWTGKLSVQDLFQKIDASYLFVGHDSMVGHLASLKEIQTLTISLGNARFRESTPYGENNFTLTPSTSCYPCFHSQQCDFFQCHSDISFQAVSEVIKILLQKGYVNKDDIKNNISVFHLNGFEIFKTAFTKNMTLKYVPVLNGEMRTLEIIQNFYSYAWKFLFSEVEEDIETPELNSKTFQDLLSAVNGIKHLFELCEFGKKYSRFILEEISSETPEIDKIKGYGEKIDEIDRLKDLVKKQHPYLAPIVNYGKMGKDNLAGRNIVEMTESSFFIFSECSSICSILYELSEHTIKMHREKNNNAKRLLNEAKND